MRRIALLMTAWSFTVAACCGSTTARAPMTCPPLQPAPNGVSLAGATCTTTPPPLVPCPRRHPADTTLPPDVARGIADAGLTLVPCDGSEYGMVHEGRRRATVEEVVAFQRRHLGTEILALEGLTSHGIGACCMRAGRPFDREGCLQISVDQGTPAAATLARELARRIADSPLRDARLAVAVTQGPPRNARCTAGDPACGPLPYAGGGKCVDVSRTSGWSRTPLTARGADVPCAHDGDCQTCNSVCTTVRAGSLICTMELNTRLRDAYCGCVAERCRWFRF